MEKIIEIARAEIGTKETPLGSNNVKYNTWFYGREVSGSKYAWCGVFVSWCYFMAGRPLPQIGWKRGFASVPKMVEYCRKNKLLTLTPVPGDIVFVDYEGNGAWDHTLLFEGWVDETIAGGFLFINNNINAHTAANGDIFQGIEGNLSNMVKENKREYDYKKILFAHI